MSDRGELGLAEGCRYEVAADKDSKSKGIFKGYAMIGSESAVVLQMPKGIMRMIPVASILYIDFLGSGERKAEEKKKPESAYYG